MSVHPLLRRLLEEAVGQKASDLHLVAGSPPTIRVEGVLALLPHDALSAQQSRELIESLFSQQQHELFGRELELNFALSLPDLGRFRVNVYVARGNVEAALRVVSLSPRTLTELGLPAVVTELCRRPSGLILVVGPAGQGKTTTLSSMIDLINRDERRLRIVTIEDPIEFLHQNVNSVIIQREVGTDTHSFQRALVQALRQDPNVICIGEIRDLETISTALTAAETGHLVMATLHSPDCLQTVERIIDVFPPHQQPQIRIQFASSIEAIIAQRLLPRADGKGRVLAVEMMLGSTAVRNTIREARVHQLTSYLDPSMDRALKELYQRGVVTYDTAMSHVRDAQYFRML